MIKEGMKAPAFTLEDQDGARISLKDYAGKRVILFFYPKANTGGWTTEATEFRDASALFTKKKTVILGCSRDKPEAQKKWAEKYDLPFKLLSDPDHNIHEKYGAWSEKNMYGKKVTGAKRTTILIGADGKVEKIWSNVKAKGHAEKIVEEL